MIEWTLIKISDLGKVVTGNTPPRKKPEYYGNHTIFIKPTDISENEKYTYKPDECYSDLGFRKYKNSLIPVGSTCVVTIGSIGKKITKAHCDCFINQAMNALIPNDNFDQEFVFYVLKYNLGQLKMLDSGTASGRENVSKSSFANIKINVPKKKDVQYRIGKTLSAYDDLIENNQKRIKLLEEIAQRTYEEWFVKFRINGEQLPIDEATGLPAGWDNVRLNDIYNIKYGKNLPQTQIKESGEYTVYGASGKMGFYSNFNCINKVVLITSRGNGSGDIHRTYENQTFVTNNSFVVSPEIGFEYLSVPYTLNFLKTINLKRYCSGSAQPQLTNASMDNILVQLPNKELIEDFNLIVVDTIEMADNLREQNQKLKQSRDILLPRLMSGTINVES